MTVEQTNAEGNDPFPVGLRVLAVDDDSTCLKYLETLLRRCQYHVTTTSQSIMALKLLRENKNKFDLVISDVHMPDMDGFKLLELVGLEMDLPVIMLSANSDPKLVMKGITHGACDYLVKPVRIEELKNIWQHVVRRKFDPKDRNNSDNQGKPHHGSGEAPGMGNSDQNGKLNKKRKDQNEEDDDDHDDNEHDNDDPSTQKKPRVVWSVELHRKFVAAVNQLGIDKAVPKKILDLMNVEKLTRENVASHLQKYRLYLKRISCVANQQANMVAALGSSDPSYLRMGSINALGSFHNLAGPPQFQNATFRSLPPSGMLGRLNSPAALSLRGIPSSVPIHLHHHTQNSDNPLSEQNKHNSLMLHGAHNGGILQGMPASLELDQLQSNGNNDSAPVFPVSSGFSDTKLLFCRSNNPLLNNNPVMLEGSNQSPVSLVSANSGSSSSHLLDHSRCTDNWSNTVQTSKVVPHSYPIGDCFRQLNLHQSNSRGDNLSTMALQMGSSNLSDASKADSQFQAVPSSKNVAPLYRSVSQEWASTNPINADLEPLGQSLDPSNTMFNRNTEYDSFGQSNFIDPLAMKINEVQRSATQTQMISKDGYLMGQQMTHGSYHPGSIGSLEDVVVSSMVKQENENVIFSEDNSFGCNAYSLRKSL